MPWSMKKIKLHQFETRKKLGGLHFVGAKTKAKAPFF